MLHCYQMFAQFFNTKFILMSLPFASTIFISFSNSSSSLSVSSHSHTSDLFPSQFHALDIHNQLCSARVLMQYVLYRMVMAKESPPGIFLIYLVGLRLHYFLLCFKWSLVFNFSIDNLQNLRILLFTPSVLLTLYSAMWNAAKCLLIMNTGYT